MPVIHDHHERTLVAPAIIAGVGVHTGRRVRLAVRPAAAGTGIVFVRTDVTDRDNRIVVSGEAVIDDDELTQEAATEGPTTDAEDIPLFDAPEAPEPPARQGGKPHIPSFDDILFGPGRSQ